MNTKKRISSRPLLVLSCFLVLMSAGILIGGICMVLGISSAPRSAGWITVVMGGALLGVWVYGANRVCNLVWVRDGILHRRGLFFGYRRACPLEDIRQAVAVEQGRGGVFLFIEDSQPGSLRAAQKDSYICLADTPENRRFIMVSCRQIIRQGNLVRK